MKRFFSYRILAVMAALLLAAFGLTHAFAAPAASFTNCFPDTDGHWAEQFVCWAFQNNIVGGKPGGIFDPEGNLTRAQAATVFKNFDTYLNGRFEQVHAQGHHYIQFGPNAWQPVGAQPISHYVNYFNGVAEFRSGGGTGNRSFQATPAVPMLMYNHVTQVTGFGFCTQANANAYLDSVRFRVYGSDENGTTVKFEYIDGSDVTDTGCYSYGFNTPQPLAFHDHVVIDFNVNYVNSAFTFSVSSAEIHVESTPTEYIFP